MKNILLLFIFLLVRAVGFTQETERRFVYFNYNDFQLTAEASGELDGMLTLTHNCIVSKVELYGHTDSDGDPAANLLLAKNRVESVKTYLVSRGVNETIIVADAFGEQTPAYTNESEEGRRKNRRVEVVFTYTCAQIGNEEPVQDEGKTRNSYEFIELQLSSPGKSVAPCAADTQHFTCKGDKEILLTGKQGTVITMYKNSIVDANGKVISGNIEFQLIEVYKKSDMIRFGLATTSGGKLLESGGMIYISATYNGEQAYFSDKVWAYEISFPTSDKKSDMGIFYADSIAGPANWIPAANSILSDMTYIENQKTLDAYIFNATEMGWINCDHFMLDKVKLTDVFVDMTTDTTGISFALVFKDINSAMASGSGHGEIQFHNVPIGYEVTLIAFRKTGETYSYFSKDLTVAKNHREPVTLENLTEDEFEKRLKELD